MTSLRFGLDRWIGGFGGVCGATLRLGGPAAFGLDRRIAGLEGVWGATWSKHLRPSGASTPGWPPWSPVGGE